MTEINVTMEVPQIIAQFTWPAGTPWPQWPAWATWPAWADGAAWSDWLSAYQIRLNEWNVGTEQDFLDSLVPEWWGGSYYPVEIKWPRITIRYSIWYWFPYRKGLMDDDANLFVTSWANPSYSVFYPSYLIAEDTSISNYRMSFMWESGLTGVNVQIRIYKMDFGAWSMTLLDTINTGAVDYDNSVYDVFWSLASSHSLLAWDKLCFFFEQTAPNSPTTWSMNNFWLRLW